MTAQGASDSAQPQGSRHVEDIERLRGRLRYFEAILKHSPDAIVTTDEEQRVVLFSKGAERLLGYREEDVVGQLAEMFYDDPGERARIRRIVERRGAIRDYETRVRTRKGRRVDVSLTLSELRDPAGRVRGTVGIARDISRRKRLERRLRQAAITDAVTRLHNRAHFNLQIREEVEEIGRGKGRLVLLMIDLDRFKEYNDEHGHLVGDQALLKAGQCLRRALCSRRETAYRYGGDEFVCLLRGRSLAVAQERSDAICRGVSNAFSGKIGASIGITEYRPGQRPRDFVREADRAMYQAKHAGGGCWSVA